MTTACNLLHLALTLYVTVDLSYAGQICLSCKEVLLPSLCDRVTRCGDHESCYMEKIITDGGRNLFNLGCRSSFTCQPNSGIPFGKKKRHYQDAASSDSVETYNLHAFQEYKNDSNGYDLRRRATSLCQACCNNTAICNSGDLCGTKKFPTAGERVCFHCNASVTPESCERIKLCGPDAQCHIQKTLTSTAYKTDCLQTKDCMIKTTRGCDQCCTGDLCNNKCSSSGTSDIGTTRPTSPAVIINITQTPAVAYTGSTIHLKCYALGHPAPSISWMILATGQGDKNVAVQNGEIVISNFQPSNNKPFACQASNPYGQDKLITHLAVTPTTSSTTTTSGSPPVIISITQTPTVAHIYDDIHLKCNVKGIPTPSISWEKLTVPGRNQDISVSNENLVYRNISADPNLKFRCLATNKFGSDSLITHLNIYSPPTTTTIPETPPKITSFGTTPTRLYYGDTVRIYCAATGYPTPQISVQFLHISGNTIPSNVNFIIRGLWEVKNFQRGNDARYRCTARNKLGQDSKEMTLHGENH